MILVGHIYIYIGRNDQFIYVYDVLDKIRWNCGCRRINVWSLQT